MTAKTIFSVLFVTIVFPCSAWADNHVFSATDMKAVLDEDTGKWSVYEVEKKAEVQIPDDVPPDLLDATLVIELIETGRVKASLTEGLWISQSLPFIRLDRAFIDYTLELSESMTVKVNTRREVLSMKSAGTNQVMTALLSLVFLALPLYWLGCCFFFDISFAPRWSFALLSSGLVLSLIAGLGFLLPHVAHDSTARALCGCFLGVVLSLLMRHQGRMAGLRTLIGASAGVLTGLSTTAQVRLEYIVFLAVSTVILLACEIVWKIGKSNKANKSDDEKRPLV